MGDRYELTFGCGWHTGEITAPEVAGSWPPKRLRSGWNKITVEVSRRTYLDWYYRATDAEPPASDVTIDPKYDDDYWWVSDYDTGQLIRHEHAWGRITMYVSGSIFRDWTLA